MPAFVDDIRQVRIVRTKHKRFTMADIGRLEKRLQDVEYYTSLSLLETDTANLQITDSDGLNRFKSGFFVDNFKKHAAHQIGHPDFSSSIDAKNGYLRPSHYTTCLDIIVGSRSFIGIGTTANPTLDINHLNDIDGENIRKTGRLLTLDYNEEEYIKQIYASRIENLNPYLITFYSGSIAINPESDVWTDTKRVDANVIEKTEEYDAAVARLGIDTQTGFGEAEWGSWQSDWSSERVTRTWDEESWSNLGTIARNALPPNTEARFNFQNFRIRRRRRGGSNPPFTPSVRLNNGRRVPLDRAIRNARLQTFRRFQDVEVTTQQSRQGLAWRVTPQITTQS